METKIRKSVIFLLFCFVFCFNTTKDLHITKNTNGKHYTYHVSYCSLSPLYIDTLSSYSSFFYTSVLNDIIIIGKKLGNLNFSICVLHILTTVMFALSLSFVCSLPFSCILYYIYIFFIVKARTLWNSYYFSFVLFVSYYIHKGSDRFSSSIHL